MRSAVLRQWHSPKRYSGPWGAPCSFCAFCLLVSWLTFWTKHAPSPHLFWFCHQLRIRLRRWVTSAVARGVTLLWAPVLILLEGEGPTRGETARRFPTEGVRFPTEGVRGDSK